MADAQTSAADTSEIPLGQLVDQHRGISYGVVQPGAADPSGVPIVRVADVRNGRIATSEPLRIAPGIEEKYLRTRLRGGELLMTLVGTVGETAIVPPTLKGWNTARAVAVIPVRPEVDARWIQCILSTPAAREYLHARLNTTVQATLNLRDVAALPIHLPPARLRTAVLEIVGALDDKIELNRRMNETLEAMARALFKSWFVDFDPVHAKAAGKKPFGIDDATLALFPSRLQHSHRGEIPVGWAATTLGEVVEFHDSKRIPLSGREREHRRGEYPYYGAASVMDYVDDYLFDGVHILVGEDGSVIDQEGHPVLQYVWGKFWVNNHAHVLRGRHAVSVEELHCFLAHCDIQPFVTGAVQPKLNQANLRRVPYIRSPGDVSQVFARRTGALYSQLRANVDQSKILVALRDTLLPKLLSGELRIKDAEKLAGEM